MNFSPEIRRFKAEVKQHASSADPFGYIPNSLRNAWQSLDARQKSQVETWVRKNDPFVATFLRDLQELPAESPGKIQIRAAAEIIAQDIQQEISKYLVGGGILKPGSAFAFADTSRSDSQDALPRLFADSNFRRLVTPEINARLPGWTISNLRTEKETVSGSVGGPYTHYILLGTLEPKQEPSIPMNARMREGFAVLGAASPSLGWESNQDHAPADDHEQWLSVIRRIPGMTDDEIQRIERGEAVQIGPHRFNMTAPDDEI